MAEQSMPVWVKVFGIVALVVAVLFVACLSQSAMVQAATCSVNDSGPEPA